MSEPAAQRFRFNALRRIAATIIGVCVIVFAMGELAILVRPEQGPILHAGPAALLTVMLLAAAVALASTLFLAAVALAAFLRRHQEPGRR